MNRFTFFFFLALLIAFVAWGSGQLLLRHGGESEASRPPAYSLEAVERGVVEEHLPSWASFVEGSALDPGTALPSPVRDERTGMIFILLPPGELLLGDPSGRGYRNEHPREDGRGRAISCRIEQPLYILRCEVTWRDYRHFLEESGSSSAPPNLPPAYPEDYPVVRVTRHEAEAFAAWAGGRLPTEAEFEYAAKGGTADLRFPWGGEWEAGDACIARQSEKLWESTAPSLLIAALQPCGSSQRDRSWCGVRDLAGSVAEWVAGQYTPQPSSLPPVAEPDLGRRLPATVRGGSWASSLGAGRCTNRSPIDPDSRADFIGFRIVREP